MWREACSSLSRYPSSSSSCLGSYCVIRLVNKSSLSRRSTCFIKPSSLRYRHLRPGQYCSRMVTLQGAGIQAVILVMYLILARRGQIGPKQHALNFGVWLMMSFGTRILAMVDIRLVNLLGLAFMGTMARMYWLYFERSRNTTLREGNETCSLGVFMGSGRSLLLPEHAQGGMLISTRWAYIRDEGSGINIGLQAVHPPDLCLLSRRRNVNTDNQRTRISTVQLDILIRHSRKLCSLASACVSMGVIAYSRRPTKR